MNIKTIPHKFKALIIVLAVVAVVGVIVYGTYNSGPGPMPLTGITNNGLFDSPPGAIRQSGEMARDYSSSVATKGADMAPYDIELESAGDGSGLVGRKVITTGSLSVVVKGAETTVNSVRAIASEFNGFVSSVNIYDTTNDTKGGHVVIRVPTESFDTVVTRIKGIVEQVTHESVDTSDVTEQFIDLGARLRNLRAEEAQYLKIMEQAKEVEDILKVSSRLSDVRGRIEQLEQQLKGLTRQIDLATLSIQLTSQADIELFGLQWRPLSVLKLALNDLLRGLTGFVDGMIILLFKLPIVLLWSVIVLIGLRIGWVIVRRLQHKWFK